MYAHTQCPWRSEEGLDALEPELEIVGSHHVSTKNQTWVPYKSNR